MPFFFGETDAFMHDGDGNPITSVLDQDDNYKDIRRIHVQMKMSDEQIGINREILSTLSSMQETLSMMVVILQEIASE